MHIFPPWHSNLCLELHLLVYWHMCGLFSVCDYCLWHVCLPGSTDSSCCRQFGLCISSSWFPSPNHCCTRCCWFWWYYCLEQTLSKGKSSSWIPLPPKRAQILRLGRWTWWLEVSKRTLCIRADYAKPDPALHGDHNTLVCETCANDRCVNSRKVFTCLLKHTQLSF